MLKQSEGYNRNENNRMPVFTSLGKGPGLNYLFFIFKSQFSLLETLAKTPWQIVIHTNWVINGQVIEARGGEK